MKKLLSIMLAITMLIAMVNVTAFADSSVTWDSNANVTDGVVTIPATKASQASFAALTDNAVIQFDYEYLNPFTTGFLSYNLIGNSGEVFRTTLNGKTTGVETTIYSKKSDLSSNYSSEIIYSTKGTIIVAVDLERQMVMIKHIDGVTKKVVMLTNDYLWGQNVTSINGFKIGASQNPGIKITNFRAFVPENFEEYYSFKKVYDFEEVTAGTTINSHDYTGSDATVIADPENADNNIVEVTNSKLLQLRPTKKEFGLNGNVYLKTRVKYTDTASTRTPNVSQFGGYSPSYVSENATYQSVYYYILETIATGDQFQVKNPKDSNVAAKTGIRKAGVWYNLEYYFNTDTDKMSMYVDGREIATDFSYVPSEFINNLQFKLGDGASTTYYVDDVEIGMYKPFSGISADDVDINSDNTITNLWEGITAEELISVISTDGNISVKDADGNVRTGTIYIGDYLEVSDITGNLVKIYTLPEIFDLSFTSAYAVLNNDNNTATVKPGRTANEIKSGFNFNVSDYTLNIIDENGNAVTGEVTSNDKIFVTIGNVQIEYTIVIKENNDYIFKWDFTSGIYPTSSHHVSQGNTTGAIQSYNDPFDSQNKTLGFVTNSTNVTGTGTVIARYNFNAGTTVSKNAVLEFDFYCNTFDETNDWIFKNSILDGKYYGSAGSPDPAMYVSVNDYGGVVAYNGAETVTYNNVVKAGEWNHFSVLIRDNFTYDIAVNGKKLNSEPLAFKYKGPENSTDYEISRIQSEVIGMRGGDNHIFDKVTLLDNVKLSYANPEIKNVKYNPYNNSLRFNYDTANANYSYTAEGISSSIKVSSDGEKLEYTPLVNNSKNYFELLLSGDKKETYNVIVNSLSPDFKSDNKYSAKLTVNTSENSYPLITSSYGEINFGDMTAVCYNGLEKETYLSGIDCTSAYTALVLTSDYTEKTGEIVEGDILRVTVGSETYDFVISLGEAIDYDISWDFEKGIGTSMAGVVNYTQTSSSQNLTVGHITDPKNPNNKTAGIDASNYEENATVYMRYDTKKWDKTTETYLDGGYSLKGSFVYQYDFYVSDYNADDDCEIKLSHHMWKYFGKENSRNFDYDYNPIIDVRVKSNGELIAVEGERDTPEVVNSVYLNFGKIIPKATWSKIAIVGLGDNTYNLYLNGEKLNNKPISYRVTESDNNKNDLSPDRFYVMFPTGANITKKTVLIDNVRAYVPTPLFKGVTYYDTDKTLDIQLDNTYVSYEFENTACQSSITVYDGEGKEISANVTFDSESKSIKAAFENSLDTELLKVKIDSLIPVSGGNALSGIYTYTLSDISVIESVDAVSEVIGEDGAFIAIYSVTNNTSKPITFYLVLSGYKSEREIVEAQIFEKTLDPGEDFSYDLALESTSDDGVLYAKAFIMDDTLKTLGNSVSTLD